MQNNSNTTSPSDENRRERIELTIIDWCVPGIILLFAFSVIYFSLQIRLAPETLVGHSMQPRSFPIFLMVLTILLTSVFIFSMVRNGTSAKAPVLWQTWFTMALIGVFVGITMTLDMFLALAVTLFCLSITFGQRRYWAAALVAVITPLIIFFAFDLGFGIRFPRGILTELYY